MGILNGFRKRNKSKSIPMYLYTEEELNEYEEHVRRCFGDYEEVFHEIVSPDIHLDVILIPPTEEAPYHKLITMGAGAYRMNVPQELSGYNLNYAEYVLYLPADWDVKSGDPLNYWPIGMLKKIARLPIDCDTWLGYGHTIHGNADAAPLAANTELNSFILLSGVSLEGEMCDFKLSSGKLIRFYELMALYQEELDFKMANDTQTLLDLLPDEEFPPIVRPDRKNYCTK